MKQRAAYITTLILLVCANALQIKANSHFVATKLRVAELTANLPLSAERPELIRNDETRIDHTQRGKTWARAGLVFAGLGFLTFMAAIIRREKGWYSMPVLLMLIYGIVITTS